MKTIEELHEWVTGVEQAFGDPSAATGMLFARYQALPAPSEDLVARYDGELRLVAGELGEIPIAIDPGGYVMRNEELVAFGIEQVMPGLWHLIPSLNIPEVLHVFVVLYDVPTPAPWERKLIV